VAAEDLVQNLTTPLAGDAASSTPEAVEPVGPRAPRPRYGLEVLLVLGVSLGISALNSLINFADIETRQGGFSHAVATLNGSQADRSWVDLSYQLVGLLSGVVPALLALYLLAQSPALDAARTGFGIGFDRLRLKLETAQGLGFAALIGIPGLGVVALARHLGVNAQIDASGLADVWYRYPILVLSGFQNGLYEEVIMIGFLLTRFRQLNWRPWTAILVSAAIRGGYHTYQGLGGFVGNFIMGAIFGYWFTRTRRVLPLVIAHAVIDVVSFVGYAALHGHLTWLVGS
jgi:membrane protease YdiL (CAAX protease family)